ncbi:MAG TPA: PQQ-dependent sugar dehydrogenase [Gemmatimonadetes bacterium]|nr:PQQ-dependent sugar dehydrogenase [Gemmatimonadota bacterium]
MVRIKWMFLLAVLTLVVRTPSSGQDLTLRSAFYDYKLTTVADGLVNPWSMAFLPNGDMLITERPGRLRLIQNGNLLPEPVAGVPEVVAQGQGGLFDVLLHPDFENNRLIYLSFSKPKSGGTQSTTAVVRARYENNQLTGLNEIFEAVSRGGGHYGGRLAFDGNGYIYITAGDRQVPSTGDLQAHPAQDLSNHHGVVVRLHDDGRIPDDNPFAGQSGTLPEIWSYGHRNPQGLAIDKNTNDVWINEHGPQGGDELNLVAPGLNYGWPVIGYGVNYSSGLAIHKGTHDNDMKSPNHFWIPSIATSGLMIYTGDRFPEWKGNIFVGGMAGQQLARLTLLGQQIIAEETLVRAQGRIRDVREGPDGYIYLAIEDRGGAPTSILRMEPLIEERPR